MPPEAMRSSLRFFFSPSWRAMRRRERRTQSDKSSASSRLPAHKGYETDLQPDRWGWRVGEAHKNFYFFLMGKKTMEWWLVGDFPQLQWTLLKISFGLFYFRGQTQLFLIEPEGKKRTGKKYRGKRRTKKTGKYILCSANRAEHCPPSMLSLFFFYSQLSYSQKIENQKGKKQE